MWILWGVDTSVTITTIERTNISITPKTSPLPFGPVPPPLPQATTDLLSAAVDSLAFSRVVARWSRTVDGPPWFVFFHSEHLF